PRPHPRRPPHRLGVDPDLPPVLLEPPPDLDVGLEVDDRPPLAVLQERRIDEALYQHPALDLHPDRPLAPAAAGAPGSRGPPPPPPPPSPPGAARAAPPRPPRQRGRRRAPPLRARRGRGCRSASRAGAGGERRPTRPPPRPPARRRTRHAPSPSPRAGSAPLR